MFKKKRRPGGGNKSASGDKVAQETSQRKREHSSDDDEGQSAVMRKERRVGEDPMRQGSANRGLIKQRVVAEEAKDKKKSIVTYKSAGAAMLGKTRNFATASNEIDTENDRDAQAQRERHIAVQEELKGKEDDKKYRGLNGYKDYIEKKDNAMGNVGGKFRSKGPMRATSNVRQTTVVDYAPDICKDYFDTGYCGFGDSCIFMHTREKSQRITGYKLDETWEKKQKEELLRKEEKSTGAAKDELPHACLICRKAFTTPVVTPCKHYFCMQCALTEFKKSTRCFACRKQINAIIAPAKEIEAAIKARRLAEALGQEK